MHKTVGIQRRSMRVVNIPRQITLRAIIGHMHQLWHPIRERRCRAIGGHKLIRARPESRKVVFVKPVGNREQTNLGARLGHIAIAALARCQITSAARFRGVLKRNHHIADRPRLRVNRVNADAAAIPALVIFKGDRHRLAAIAIYHIIARAAEDLVIAITAEDLVIARTAEDPVIARVAEDLVIARAAEDLVIAITAHQMVIPVTALDHIIPVGAPDHIICAAEVVRRRAVCSGFRCPICFI